MIRFITEMIFQYIAKLKAHNSCLYWLEPSISKSHCQIGANYHIDGPSLRAQRLPQGRSNHGEVHDGALRQDPAAE